METKYIYRFLCHNTINYNTLPYSGEHEAYRDYTHKKKWGAYGKKAIIEIAKNLNCNVDVSYNPSGDIDRGYINAFFERDGVYLYVQFSDGMRDILYRTAKHAKDYTGGQNHTAPLTGRGIDILCEWVKNNLVK